MKNSFILRLLLTTFFFVGCGKTPLIVTQTIDLAGPQFSFSILNASKNNETVSKEYEELEVCAGDMLYIYVESIDYDKEAANTINLSIFDIEESFANQENVNMPIEVPEIEPGKYPATVTYIRDIKSSDTNQWVGIKTKNKTLYVVVR